MADIWSTVKRSEVMSRIKSKDTSCELLVRSMLHRSGYRFRVHRIDLPGTPDIVLPRYDTVIFVHGCFWHHHTACIDGRYPKSNRDYWREKINRNVARDMRHRRKLWRLGWRVLTVRECQIEHSPLKVLQRICSTIKQPNNWSHNA